MSKQTAANLRAEWRIFYFANKKCETEKPDFYLGFHCLNQRHMEELLPFLDRVCIYFLRREVISSYLMKLFEFRMILQMTPHIGRGMTEAREGVWV